MGCIQSFFSKQEAKNQGGCIICFYNMYDNDILALPCSHIFHKACIKKWLGKNPHCPICDTCAYF